MKSEAFWVEEMWKDSFYECIFCGKKWQKDPNSFLYCDCDKSKGVSEKLYEKWKDVPLNEIGRDDKR